MRNGQTLRGGEEGIRWKEDVERSNRGQESHAVSDEKSSRPSLTLTECGIQYQGQ